MNFPADETQSSAAKSITTRAAWSPTAIVWLNILLSPLPAGILYALNYDRFGQPEKKKRALYFVLAGSILLYGSAFWLAFATDDNTDARLRPLYVVITLTAAWHFYLSQQNLFAQHIKDGGKKASIWPPVLATFLSLALVCAVAFVWLYVQTSNDYKQFNQAIVLMEQGKFQEAENAFKKFKARQPEEPGVYWHLITIYLETERTDLARQELREYLQLEPNSKEAKDILRELEN